MGAEPTTALASHGFGIFLTCFFGWAALTGTRTAAMAPTRASTSSSRQLRRSAPRKSTGSMALSYPLPNVGANNTLGLAHLNSGNRRNDRWIDHSGTHNPQY